MVQHMTTECTTIPLPPHLCPSVSTTEPATGTGAYCTHDMGGLGSREKLGVGKCGTMHTVHGPKHRYHAPVAPSPPQVESVDPVQVEAVAPARVQPGALRATTCGPARRAAPPGPLPNKPKTSGGVTELYPSLHVVDKKTFT